VKRGEKVKLPPWRSASVASRSPGEGGTIGDREEEGRGEKLRKVGKMKGRMVNGRVERVHIVAQAARGRHTQSGSAKPHGVIHRFSLLSDTTSSPPAPKPISLTIATGPRIFSNPTTLRKAVVVA
jgi:hypothetical protein